MPTTNALLDAVCAPENISLAWSRFARCRGMWAPGLPMGQVAKSPVLPVLMLAEEMRRGRYRPQPAHRVPVRKADGGLRELHIYMIRDRVAQRALLQVLQPQTDPHMSPMSFGFRPGRSVAQAVHAVQRELDAGLCWVGDADVEKCFDRMVHRHALHAVEDAAGGAAAGLLRRWMGWPAQVGAETRGLAQGSVLAPWVCNLYLAPLDARIQAAGLGWVRYADDFVLLAPTRRMAEEGLSLCAQALGALGLALHPVKTAVRHAALPFRFLGQWLAATPLLPAPCACPQGS